MKKTIKKPTVPKLSSLEKAAAILADGLESAATILDGTMLSVTQMNGRAIASAAESIRTAVQMSILTVRQITQEAMAEEMEKLLERAKAKGDNVTGGTSAPPAPGAMAVTPGMSADITPTP
jgi:hypothetical protein